MRKRFLVMVVAVAIAGPAAAADLSSGVVFSDETFTPTVQPAVQGDIELSFGWIQLDPDDDDEASWYAFQGWGRANVPLGSTWNLLVETGGRAIFGGDLPDGFSNSDLNAVGHLWGGDGFRYGGFGGVTFGGITSRTMASVGLEMEVDIGNATLGAQGFYSWITDNCPLADCDVYGARGWLDYYFGPNTKLTGEIDWAQSGDVDVYGGRGRLTHRFAGTPLNVFAEGGYWRLEPDSGGGNVVRIGGGITIVIDGNGNQQLFDQNVPFTFRRPPALEYLGT